MKPQRRSSKKPFRTAAIERIRRPTAAPSLPVAFETDPYLFRNPPDPAANPPMHDKDSYRAVFRHIRAATYPTPGYLLHDRFAAHATQNTPVSQDHRKPAAKDRPHLVRVVRLIEQHDLEGIDRRVEQRHPSFSSTYRHSTSLGSRQ